MTAGARTPEEMETLLEDAFVSGEPAAFQVLFDDAAVLVEAGGLEVRGGGAISLALADLGSCSHTYLACPQRVLQARDTALVIADAGTHVVRRGSDGAWRAAISLLDININGDGDR
jgi:ketosteroid isomerase-like protein